MSDQPKRKSASQPPVSAHPAFPVIVALWFAALFGIGSMVLPLDLFERLSVSSGLADMYQGAQPPLGATARIVVALVASLIGAGAGLFVARRVAAASAPRTVGRRAAALQPSQTPRFSAKRPISAHEELGEGGLDAEEEPAFRATPAARRRSLAVTDDSAPSDFLAFAPLPGQSANDAEEPLDLVAFEEPETTYEEVAEEPVEAEAEPVAFGTATLSTPPFTAPFVEEPSDETQFAEPAPELELASGEAPVTPLADRPLGELGVVELVERFALALQRHQHAAVDPADSAKRADEPTIDAGAYEAPTLEVVADAGVEPEPAAEELPPLPVLTLPTALRPFGFDEDEDNAELLPALDLTGALAQGRGAFAPPAPEDAPAVVAMDVADDAEDEDESAEAGYTSLLAMKSPFSSRETVRIDDDDDDESGEPIVVFPGQAVRRASPAADGPARDAHAPARPFDAPMERAEHPAMGARQPATDPGATERALREALEKLQRMSGAA